MRRVLLPVIVGILGMSTLADAYPVPPARFYGRLIIDGKTLQANDPALNGLIVRVFPTGTQQTLLASYTMSNSLDGRYRLTLLLDSANTPSPNTRVDLWVNEVLAASNIVLSSGVTQVLDLSAAIDQAPELHPVPPLEATEGQTFQHSLSATDPDGDLITFSASGLPPGASLSETGLLSFTPGFDQAGHYELTLSATARGKSDSQAQTLKVNNVDQPPVLAPFSPLTIAEQERLNLTLQASDPDGDLLSFSASGLPLGATLHPSTGVLSWTPGFDQAGTYAVLVTVQAQTLSDAATLSLTVMNVDRPPYLTLPEVIAGAEADPLSYLFKGSDPDGDALSWSVQGLPSGAAVEATTGQLTLTPGYDQAGTYPLVVRLTAGGEVVQGHTTLSIANTDRAPQLVPMAPQTLKVGTLFESTVQASDPDGDAITLTAANLPEGARFEAAPGASSGLLRFTPTQTQGGKSYQVLFTASALGLADTTSLTLTVEQSQRPPTLNPILPQTLAEGATLRLQLEGSDPDGDALSYGMSGAPAGMTLNISSGQVEWTPGYSAAGGYSVGFTVSSQDGSATETVSITVINTDRAPIFGPIGTFKVQRSSSLSFYLRAVDPDGDTVNYGYAGTLPTGLTIDTVTGKVTVSSGSFTAGTYSFPFLATANGLSTQQVGKVQTYDRNPKRSATEDEGSLDSARWTFSGTPVGGLNLYPVGTTSVPFIEAKERSNALMFDNQPIVLSDWPVTLTISSDGVVGSGYNPQRRLVFEDESGRVLALTAGVVPETGSYDLHLFDTFTDYDRAILGEQPVSTPLSTRLCSTWSCNGVNTGVLASPGNGVCRLALTLTSTQLRLTVTPTDAECQAWDSGWVSHGGRLSRGRFGVGIAGNAHTTSGTKVVSTGVKVYWSGLSFSGLGALCADPVSVGSPNSSRVQIFCQGRNSLPFSSYSGAASSQIGTSSLLEDLDADGFPELIVGNPGATSGKGTVLVYRGTKWATDTSLAASEAVSTLTGRTGDGLGQALVTFTREGVRYLAIGAPRGTGGIGAVAIVPVSSLLAAGPAVSEWLECDGLARGCGSALLSGDVDQDGFDELLIGAPSHGAGEVQVYRQGRMEPDGTPWRTFEGELAGDRFGSSLMLAPLDGLELSLLVGAPGALDVQQLGTAHGALYTFSASHWSLGESWIIADEALDVRRGGSEEQLGSALSWLDLTGDGLEEVLASAPGCSTCAGRVGFWSVEDLLLGTLLDAGSLAGFVPGERFGSSLAPARGGLLVGARDDANNLAGALYRFGTGSTVPTEVLTGVTLKSRFGQSVTVPAQEVSP